MPAPTFAEQPLDTTVLNKLAAADVDEPTDVPGVMWSHVRPVTVVYGERSGLALDPVNVAEGRLRELRQMNNHHVYDYVPLAEIPKGQRIETARWLDDLNPAAEDPEAVRSRVDDQMARDECFQGTPPLKAVRAIISLASSKQPLGRRIIGLWDARVAFFHALMDEPTVVMPPKQLRRHGYLLVLRRALYGTRQASRLFGQLVADVLRDPGLIALKCIPNVYHHPQRDIDLVAHGDDFMADAEDHQLDLLEKILDDAIELKKVGRIGPGQQSSGHMLKREIRWNPEGFSWEADRSLIPKLLEGLGLEKAKGAPTPGTKDVGKDDRDSLDVLDDAERKIVQSAVRTEACLALLLPGDA